MRTHQFTAVWAIVFWSACAGRTKVTPIPFELYRNQIVVPVYVNEKGPYTMIIDTGANPSAIDVAVALEAGVVVDTTRSGFASGAGSGQTRIFDAPIQRMQVGGFKLAAVDALAVDLSGLAGRFGRPLHGVLGYSVLSGRRVRINYPQRELDLNAPASACGGERSVIPFRFVDGQVIPVIDIRVNGQTIPVSIDSGSSLTLELYPDAVAQLGLHAAANQEARDTLMGARGSFTAAEGVVDSIGVGSFQVPQARVSFTSPETTSRNRSGNAGNALLSAYCVTVDYGKKVLVLEKP